MNKDLMEGLARGGAIVAIALGATLARKLGYVDGDTVTRVVIGMNGLMVAWYGNRMPKAVVPSARIRQAERVGGWAIVLSGLVYAAVWAYAPIPVAITVGTAAILAGLAVTAGYCFWLRAKAS